MAEHPSIRAAGVTHPVLVLEAVSAALEVIAKGLIERWAVLGMNARQPALDSGRPFVVQTDQLHPPRREVDRVGLQVPVPESVLRSAGRERVPLLAVLQRNLRAMVFADVPD